MSHFDPSASLSSLASTATERAPTPDSSTANLLPPLQDNPSDRGSSTPSSPSARPSTSHAHPTTAPRTQTYPSSPSSPHKDYEQAYATLSSAWGFGASVPAKNPKSAKAKERGGKKDQDKKDKKDKQRRREGEQNASQSSSSLVSSRSRSSIASGQRSPGSPLQSASAQNPPE